MWLHTHLDMSWVNNAPIPSVPPTRGTTSSFFAPSLSSYGCYHVAAGVTNLRGISIRAAAAATPLPILLLILLPTAVKGAVASVLSDCIVSVDEAAQVFTLERFFGRRPEGLSARAGSR